MAAARAASCCLIVLVAVACGSGGHARKDAVNTYLGEVQTAQASLVGGQGQIDLTLQAFSLTKAPPSELQRLQRERRTVAATLKRLRALDPPPDAKHLHALLVERVGLQVALFDSLIETMRDVPRITAAGAPLTAAARRLSGDLSRIGGSQVKSNSSQAFLAQYADAFGRYGDALEPVAAKLAPAAQPSLLRPTIAAEHTVLARSIGLCNTIRTTLHLGDTDGANAAIHSLLSLTQTVGGDTVRKAQQVAARAYNAKVTRIDRLATSISEERAKLVQRVG